MLITITSQSTGIKHIYCVPLNTIANHL